jgi:hypothetical protein
MEATMKTWTAAFVLAAAAGCAGGSGQSRKESVRATADEVAATFDGAQVQLTAAVSSLSTMVTSSQADLPKTYERYVTDLKGLDGKVAHLRALSTEISARRDEYLQHWVEKTQGISSADLKARAEKRRAELGGEFQTIVGKGQAVKRAFAPLHTALQDLAKFLDADLTPGTVQALKPELDAIRSMNVEVQKLAEDYRAAMQDFRAKLSSGAAK